MSLIFDDNFERVILGLCLSDLQFFLRTIVLIKPQYFTNKDYKSIYVFLLKFYKEHKTLPDKDAFIGEIEDYSILEKVFTTMKLKESTKSALLKKVEEWMKRQKAVEATQLNIEDIKKGIYDHLEERMKEVAKISIDVDLGIDYLNEINNRITLYKEEDFNRIVFSDRFKAFNNALGGGIPRKTFSIIQAKSNLGKSLILNAFSRDLLEMHQNVIYITLEISNLQIMKRIDAMVSGIAPSDLILNEEQLINSLKNLKNTTMGNFFIKEYPPGSVTVNNIRNYLNDLYLQKDILPDVVVVDYMDLMRSVANVSLSDTYLLLRYISEELRALAMEFNCAVFSASQIQRSAYKMKGNEDLGMESGATSIGKSETADLVLSLSQDEVLESIDTIKGYVAKCRFARPHKNIMFSVNYDCLDVKESAVMTKYEQGMTKADIINEFYPNSKKKQPKQQNNVSSKNENNFNEEYFNELLNQTL